jgi:hypothetical protein
MNSDVRVQGQTSPHRPYPPCATEVDAHEDATIGGGLFYIGVRYRRAGARDKMLRERGIRASASVRSYKESNLVVDGITKFDLVLEVDAPGRVPYVVRQSDYVPHPWAVKDGVDLPVFIHPSNANDVMVDWFTMQTR